MRAHVVTDRGSGHAVVLLHGQPGSARDWDAVVDALDDRLRVIVPDRPGYGDAEPDALGIAGNAREILALLDERGIESATVVGHSWAGAVALLLAQRHPDRVDGLVLAASIGPGSLTVFDRLLAAPVLGEALSWGGTHAVRRFVSRDRGRAFVAGRFGERAPESLRTSLRGQAWRSFVVEQRAMVRELPSIVARIADIRAPTVVLAGDRDRIVSAATARALAAGIPSARLAVISGVGHAQPLDAPEAVSEAIASVVALGGRPRPDGRPPARP
jgi:pimeloyl-ACP methyl ester carboxylesterase